MTRTSRTLLTGLSILLLVGIVPPASAGPYSDVPEWVRPALRYLVDAGAIERESFEADATMPRARFKQIIEVIFGGGYARDEGDVKAREVARTLVRKLGRMPLAKSLRQVQSPDGWAPVTPRYFGTEIVAREFGLRYNRPANNDDFETSAQEAMPQADVVYSVWKAATSPSYYSADALGNFRLPAYSETRRSVVQFALSLVGTPYVWGGEWPAPTPSSYPYGAQAHGGFDCSGFAWYVLKEKSASFSPVGRPYKGWSFPERSSAEMAKAAPKRLGYKELLPGDVVFFAPDGRDAKARTVYHAGIYLGEGWMVHSSGSRAGISLGEVGPGSWWHDQLAWGRRLIPK